MGKPTSTNNVTPEEVIAQARVILAEANRPLPLSRLGQELNRALNTSIRTLLGQRPLADFLLEAIGDEYEVQGSGPHKEIGRRGTWQIAQKYTHYFKEFWESFERPLEPGKQRWILPGTGGRSVDQEEPPSADGALEIESHFIVDASIEPSQKGRAVRQSITTWAKAHCIDLSQFEVKPKEFAKPYLDHSSSNPNAGVLAIRYMIEAVPPEDRGRYTISLDLLARLLNLG